MINTAILCLFAGLAVVQAQPQAGPFAPQAPQAPQTGPFAPQAPQTGPFAPMGMPQQLTAANVGSSLTFDLQLAGAEVTTYAWDVDVRAPRDVTTQVSQRAVVDYQVAYDRTAVGTAFALSGTIDITNNLRFDVAVYGVRLAVTPVNGAPFYVEAECPGGDGQAILLAANDMTQCAVQEPLKAAAGASPLGGRAQVQLRLTPNGGFGYTAPGPVNYDFNSPDQVEQNECALVFDTFSSGSSVPQPRGTNVAPLAGLLTIQPEVSRGANKPASTVGTAAKICENTVYKFTVVAGPFPAESCGSRQVYYTAFAYPVELARDDESDNTPFPVDEQLAVASAATRVTITGCQPAVLPARVGITARPAVVSASNWGVVQRVSGLTATRPSNIIAVDYRRGGRLNFNTAVTKTPGRVVSRVVRGTVQVTNPNQPGTNVMLVGTISVVVRQATVANAAVTCPGGSARVNLFAGQTVTCTYSAPVQSESTTAAQATFTTSSTAIRSNPATVTNWFNAESVSANNCANVRDVWRFTAVNPSTNVPPRVSVAGNIPNGRTCNPAAYSYAAVIPTFRPTQCGRYELVSSVTVAPIVEVAGVVSRPAVKQDRIFVDVTGCPGFAINLPGFSLAINLG